MISYIHTFERRAKEYQSYVITAKSGGRGNQDDTNIPEDQNAVSPAFFHNAK
jgi:hypothetical protein